MVWPTCMTFGGGYVGPQSAQKSLLDPFYFQQEVQHFKLKLPTFRPDFLSFSERRDWIAFLVEPYNMQTWLMLNCEAFKIWSEGVALALRQILLSRHKTGSVCHSDILLLKLLLI